MHAYLRTASLGLLWIALAAGCGGASDVDAKATAGVPRKSAVRIRRSERNESDRARELRRMIEWGQVDLAEPLLEQLGGLLGAELDVLRARIAFVREPARLASWNPILERVKQSEPYDPRGYAAAAELYAAIGQDETALLEIRAGLAACGERPEFERAIAVRLLGKTGGAERARDGLLRAREQDPSLPFCDRPLARAHALVARKAQADGRMLEARAEVERSLSLDPGNFDTRRFAAELLASAHEFERAIAMLEGLCAEGESLHIEWALLEKRAAMMALLAGHHEDALVHFAAARRLGLDDEGLGTGTKQLADAVDIALGRTATALGAGDFESARQSVERALRFEPENIGAWHLRANLDFREQRYDAAVEGWTHVLEVAEFEQFVLPEPVHLNLSRALFLSDQPEASRLILERYLERYPNGEHAAATRKQLDPTTAE